jgi:hypothetical protein
VCLVYKGRTSFFMKIQNLFFEELLGAKITREQQCVKNQQLSSLYNAKETISMAAECMVSI